MIVRNLFYPIVFTSRYTMFYEKAKMNEQGIDAKMTILHFTSCIANILL